MSEGMPPVIFLSFDIKVFCLYTEGMIRISRSDSEMLVKCVMQFALRGGE